ncbi:serine hydrolase domain-containing protein [Streptomyces aureus]|uniref:serine hydrolase domain-containing protein n=1 Tax=Streptomyces aureus TaxID=193461 RepID=UPI00363F1009
MTSPDISSGNWLTPPHHRLGLHRVEDVVPCTTIARGEAPARMLVPASKPLDWDLLTVPGPQGMPISAQEFLARTHTDGILVLRGDTILAERYFGEFTSASHHIVMSISKSFAGMLAGVLAGAGLLDLEATVPTYVPELAAGSYAGATVGQLLDMTAAPHYDMSYQEPTAEVHAGDRAAGWRPRRPEDVVGTRPFLAQLRGAGRHGADFQYCSGTTDVLAWVLERAGGAGYGELMRRHLWSWIGAEDDAFVTVDDHGTPYACAGMGMRLRDLARFGRLVLDDGWREGTPVVPADWIARTRRGGSSRPRPSPTRRRVAPTRTSGGSRATTTGPSTVSASSASTSGSTRRATSSSRSSPPPTSRSPTHPLTWTRWAPSPVRPP